MRLKIVLPQDKLLNLVGFNRVGEAHIASSLLGAPCYLFDSTYPHMTKREFGGFQISPGLSLLVLQTDPKN